MEEPQVFSRLIDPSIKELKEDNLKLAKENDDLVEKNIQLKQQIRGLNKGINKLMLKRKKWKERYYKLRKKVRG